MVSRRHAISCKSFLLFYFKLVISVFILASSSSFVLHGLYSISHLTTKLIIINRIVISLTDIRVDVVAEIFSLSRLGSPACIAFVFITIDTACRERMPMVVLWVNHLMMAEFFLLWEKPKEIRLEEMLELVQKLSSLVVPLPLQCRWEKWVISHIAWETPNVFMHYLL